ncbi:MAG: acyl-CoA/acyl-ACP dehydrogenase [Caulobacteraceae bacterium]|nr:acyl-CoA/acyl-ACP dehydrogenase [Caulobacteraceae bacterium]
MLNTETVTPGVSFATDEPAKEALAERTRAAVEAAAQHAADVDLNGRFPTESFEAIRANRLLGAMVPAHLGGEGLSLAQVADICFALGRACGSTALIFAMHQVKVACLIRHHGGSTWQLNFLRRVASEQLLLGSSTTEGKAGGAVRSSSAPIEPDGQGVRLLRAATVVSYGEQADAIVTTARRNPDAAAADQVLAVFLREDYRLERTGGWNTLGMRGTCSMAFGLEARGQSEQVLAAPYAEIHARTMTPAAHLLWGAVWAGIAAEAVERARLHMRKAMRGAGDQSPPGAGHLPRAKTTLQSLVGLLSGALARYAAIGDDAAALEALDYQASVSMLKVQASELAVSTVMSAMQACGLAGYRNDGDASVGRLLRDVLSAPLMISNDRILADLQAAALMDRGPASLSGGAI